jgi:large subunit ribosomal protein L13
VDIVQVNAEKVAVTGKKRSQKLYRRHSGRPGGMTEETFESLQRRIPERIIEHAVRGMLPKGRVGISLFLPLFHTVHKWICVCRLMYVETYIKTLLRVG